MMRGSLAGPPIGSSLLVVDSWPVVEWLKNREPLVSRFGDLLESAHLNQVLLVMSSFNLGEVYYIAWNQWGRPRAEEILIQLRDSPITFFHPTEEDVLAAARIKAQYRGSYADAFAVVLAIEFDAPVLTGDPDFLKTRLGGLVQVEWWGK